MIRTSKYKETAMILSSLEHFHRVHQNHSDRIIIVHGIEHYNETEERFYHLIKKYDKKFNRMRKRRMK